MPVFEASLQLFRSLGDNWHSAWVLINLGDVSLQRGEIDRALQFFSEARDLFSVLNHKRGQAHAIDRLGRLAIWRHDPGQAMNLYSESFRLFREIGELNGCALSLQNLGRLESEYGQKSQAIEYLIESLRLFRNLNDRWGLAWSLLRLAIVVRDLPRPDQAALLFGAAESMLAEFKGRAFNWDHRDFIEDTLTEARAQSGAAAWANGQTLSFEKVMGWILKQRFIIE